MKSAAGRSRTLSCKEEAKNFILSQAIASPHAKDGRHITRRLDGMQQLRNENPLGTLVPGVRYPAHSRKWPQLFNEAKAKSLQVWQKEMCTK